MRFSEIINTLQKRKNSPLPGEIAYKKIYPATRKKYNSNIKPENPKQSAVLILFCKNEQGETYIPLIKRVHDGGKHSGQVSFPGGKYEFEDKSYEKTALRETAEEIGMDESKVDVLMKLSPLYIPVSNFMVHPYIGFTDTIPEFTPSPDEVEEVVNLYFSELSHPKIISKEMNIEGKITKIPFYKFKEFELWGATAMILSELMEILAQSES